MSRLAHVAILLLPGLLLPGCVPPLVPGADQLRITQNAADVAGCVAVGNLDPAIPGDPRNQAVGLGGNVVFELNRVIGPVTLGGAINGVVYRCASATTPAAK
jgi:hypothetical protein